MNIEEFSDKAVRLCWHTLEFAGFLWNEDMLKAAVKQCVDYPYSTPEDIYNKVNPGQPPYDRTPFAKLEPVARVPYGLVVTIVDTLRHALLEREKGSCGRRCFMQRITEFECGLPARHEGPCIPVGGLPLKVTKPEVAA